MEPKCTLYWGKDDTINCGINDDINYTQLLTTLTYSDID